MDSVELTLLRTQGTADTTVVAFCFYIFALVMGIALYQMLRRIRNQFYKV